MLFITLSFFLAIAMAGTSVDPEPYCYDLNLIIDRDFVHIIRLSDGEEVSVSKMPRWQSHVLVYNPGYTFNNFLDSSRRIKDGTIVIKPELYIASVSNKYLFGNGLSQSELYWLGQELSSFMNLELQVIYPTPKEPPESQPM
jgi:hypothetical protein